MGSQELQNQEGVIQIVEVFFCTFCQLRTCDLNVQGCMDTTNWRILSLQIVVCGLTRKAESKVLCGRRCWRKLQEMHD